MWLFGFWWEEIEKRLHYNLLEIKLHKKIKEKKISLILYGCFGCGEKEVKKLLHYNLIKIKRKKKSKKRNGKKKSVTFYPFTMVVWLPKKEIEKLLHCKLLIKVRTFKQELGENNMVAHKKINRCMRNFENWRFHVLDNQTAWK